MVRGRIGQYLSLPLQACCLAWLAGMALSAANWGLWPCAWLTPGLYLCMLRLVLARQIGSGWLAPIALLAGVAEAWVLLGLICHSMALFGGCCLLYGLHRWLTFRLMLAVLTGATARWQPILIGCAWATAERLLAAIPYSLPTLLADSQTMGPGLWLMPWCGTYGVAAVMAAVACWVLQRAWYPVAGALLLSCCTLLSSAAAMEQQPATFELQVVQGGLSSWMYARQEVDQSSYWLVDWYSRLSMQRHEMVSPSLKPAVEPVPLIIWPETALPYVWGVAPELTALLQHHARHIGPLLIGMPIAELGTRSANIFNGAVWLDSNGHVAGLWSKQRLALLAEQQFTPMSSAGPLLPWQAANLAIVFCLETTVPELLQAKVQEGATAIVALADGSGFGAGLVGWMHSQRAIVRSAELGRAVVHASSDGAGLVVWPQGKGMFAKPIGKAWSASATTLVLPSYTHSTPWVRFGDWSRLPMLLACVGACLAALVRPKAQPLLQPAATGSALPSVAWLFAVLLSLDLAAQVAWTSLSGCQGALTWPPPISNAAVVQFAP